MISLAVRPAQADDADSLMRLRLAYFQSQLDIGLLDGLTDIEAHVRSGTPGLLTTSRARVVVTERDRLLVGYSIATFRVVPGARQPSVCSIDEVFVSPQFRGTGLASQLVASLLEEAILRKVDRTQIRVLARNQKARVLWEQLGFVENVVILEYAGPMPEHDVEKIRGRE